MNTKLKTNYEKACNAYLKAFCDKHGFDYDPDYWISGDVGGIIEVSDYFMDMETIRTDIDRDAPREEFVRWYDYSLRLSTLDAGAPNYRSWLAGCPRRSETEIAELEQKRADIERLKQEFKDMIKETTQTPTSKSTQKPTENE